MQIIDDFNKLYVKAKEFFFGYVIGYGIGLLITLIVLIALLSGWSPIPKSISQAPKKQLPMCYGLEWYDGAGNKHINK
jgi:hypothetical protein